MTIYIPLGIVVLFIGWVVFQVSRSLHAGTYRQYEAGEAPWVWQEPWTIGVIGFALAVFWIALSWFYRDLRRA